MHKLWVGRGHCLNQHQKGSTIKKLFTVDPLTIKKDILKMARVLFYVVLSQIASNGWLYCLYCYLQKDLSFSPFFTFIFISTIISTIILILSLSIWILTHWDDGHIVSTTPSSKAPLRPQKEFKDAPPPPTPPKFR